MNSSEEHAKFRPEDTELFLMVVHAMGSDGLNGALRRFGRSKYYLKKKWELYHLRDFGKYIVSENNKHTPQSQTHKNNRAKMNRALHRAGFDKRRNKSNPEGSDEYYNLQKDAGQYIAPGRANRYFEAFADFLDYKDEIKILRTFLAFTTFCLEDNDGVLTALYEGEPEDSEEDRLKQEECARIKLAIYVNGLAGYIGNLDRPPERIVTLTSDETWLSPYNSLQIPFVGREYELKRLDEYIEARSEECSLLIWSIVAPSGSGKTRLLVHWANSSKILEGWEIIGLNGQFPKTSGWWEQWLPEKNTLIVLEYTFEFEVILNTIIRRSEGVRAFKVRLLIVDRNIIDPIWEDRRWGFDGKGENVDLKRGLFFSSTPLTFSSSNAERINTEIVAACAGLPPDNKSVLLAIDYLRKKNGAWRPLFCALVGRALKNERDFYHWNRRDLIYYYLSGEGRIPWEIKGEEAVGRWAGHFVAVATIFDGVSYLYLTDSIAELPDAPKNLVEVKDVCKRLTSCPDANFLSSLIPDLLGETFFLLYLKHLFEADGGVGYQAELFNVLLPKNEIGVDEKIRKFASFMLSVMWSILTDDPELKQMQSFACSFVLFLASPFMRKQKSFHATSSIIAILMVVKKEQSPEVVARVVRNLDIEIMAGSSPSYMVDESIEALCCIPEFYNYRPGVVRVAKDAIDAILERCMPRSAFRHEEKLIRVCRYGRPEVVALYLSEYDFSKADTRRSMSRSFWAAALENKECPLRIFEMVSKYHPMGWDARDGDGGSLLELVAWKGDVGAFNLILEKNPNVEIDSLGFIGYTPLLNAVVAGHATIVNALLMHGADIKYTNELEMVWPLFLAVRHGHVDIVKLILEYSENVGINSLTRFGETPLMVAAKEGRVDILMLLVNYGVEVGLAVRDRCRYGDRRTALLYAVENDQVKATKLLLKHGARLWRDGNYGVKIISKACKNRSKVMLDLLLEEFLPTTEALLAQALYAAVDSDFEYGVLRMLLESPNVNYLFDGRTTLLMVAAQGDHLSIGRALLEAGAKKDVSDIYEQTAESLAKDCGRFDFVKMLEEYR